ncbi:hypothetical protein R1sor_018057 [Riccia sorocarpa]|uniref:Uncharacterized protein n=1 Tax=Riccia sorocarpa TaxID=122646 RepID=A0ABD3I8L6_9MARC
MQNTESCPLLFHAEVHQLESRAGEKKRNSARRLSMLTKNGEDLGWAKHACQLDSTEETLGETTTAEMAEDHISSLPTSEVNIWGVPANTVRYQTMSQPVPRTNPATSHINGSPQAQANSTPNVSTTSRAQTLPSLRDIMAEQDQQRATLQTQATNLTKRTASEPTRSYAKATAPGTTNTAHPPKPTLTNEEIRKRVAGILETIPKPMERATPSKIMKYKLSDTAAEEFGKKTLDLENR